MSCLLRSSQEVGYEPGKRTIARKKAYSAETVVSAPPRKRKNRASSWVSIEAQYNLPPYIELAVNLKSLISSGEREFSCSRLVDTKDGGAFPATWKLRELNHRSKKGDSVVILYHFLLGKVIGNVHHGSSVFGPKARCLQEARSRKPFRQTFKNREEINREGAWNRSGIEIAVGLFNQVDEGIFTILYSVAVRQPQNPPASLYSASFSIFYFFFVFLGKSLLEGMCNTYLRKWGIRSSGFVISLFKKRLHSRSIKGWCSWIALWLPI